MIVNSATSQMWIRKTLAHFKVQVNFHVHITHSPRFKIEYTFAMVGDYIGMDPIIFKIKIEDCQIQVLELIKTINSL
jgi:hypothetical protein